MVSIQLAAVVLTVSGIGQTVLYDFTAEWCGPCKMMEPAIGQLQSIGYPVQKVNIDQQPDLAKRYGITSVPCVVLVVNGQEVGRHLGVASYHELAHMLSQAGVRPVVAVARGQGGEPRRPRLGWPRDRAQSKSSRTSDGATSVPRVSLGQEVPSPYANQTTQAGPAAAPVGIPAVIPPAASANPRINVPIVNPPAAEPPRIAVIPPSPAPGTSPPAMPKEFAAVSTPIAPTATPPFRRELPASPPAGSTPTAPSASNTPPPDLTKKLIAATVRLRVQDNSGQSIGSGSIIDFRPSSQRPGGEALILTCGHIFRDSQGKGPIHVDLFDDSGQLNISGRMIRFDLARDIGLVSIAINHPVQTVDLATNEPPERGHRVISIGCDHGRAPTVQRSQVMAVNSFVGPPNVQVAGQPAVGRSGGGLFNDRGQLIGVCNFADPTDRAGLYAATEVATGILQEAGIQLAQYQTPKSKRAMPAAKLASQQLTDIGSPTADLINAGPTTPTTADQPTEVICIVRTKNATNTQRQVIVIENAPVDLLNRLASEQQKQQGTYPTTMDVAPAKTRRLVTPAPR
jgi:thiol-disulfide isomerase/thioredoxin